MDERAQHAVTRDAIAARKHETDVVIGRRLRLARETAGISQEVMGAALGLTFQQVQKYEKAKNRISPGNLAIVAETTGRDVAWFFGAAPADQERRFVVRVGALFVAQGAGQFSRYSDGAVRFTFAEAQALATLEEDAAVHAATDFAGDEFRSPASLLAELTALRRTATADADA